MTGQDIKDRIERYTDTTLKNNIILDGIEDAINFLGNWGYLIDIIDVLDSNVGEYYELPSDIIKILKVEKIEEEEYYYDYLIDDGQIRFGDEGDYRIFAQRHPIMIDNIDGELELHPMLANCVKNYTMGYVLTSHNAKNEYGHRLMQQFKKNAQRAYLTIKRNQKNPTQIRVRRHA